MKKILFHFIVMGSLVLPAFSLAQNQQYDISPQPQPQSQPCMPMSALGMPLDLLPPQKCAKAIAIMDDFKKKSFNLRQLIATKKHELESLSFDQKTSPDTLPRLGYELQVLRDELRAAHMNADQRMRLEVGVPLGTLASRGCSMDFEHTAWSDRLK